MELTDLDLKTLLLQAPARSLAVAESLTAGQVQARVGAISGASQFFHGGLTAYTLAAKVNQLGVDQAEAERCDCVSEAVAIQMARGVAERFGATIGVATTGYAEPSLAAGVTTPYAWWALVDRSGGSEGIVRSGRVDCPNLDREGVQRQVTDTVWGALLVHLRGTSKSPV